MFVVEEASAGVYVVRAFDRQGLRIELKGQDPDALLDQCRAETGQAIVEPDSRDSS